MQADTPRMERHGRKILVASWIAAIVGGLAICEWVLTPADGRYKAYGNSSGTAPRRHLLLREWKRNTDYHFAPTEERKRFANGGLSDIYTLSTDSDGFITPGRAHAEPDVTIAFLGGSTTECLYVASDKRFPGLVARRLEQELGLKINSLNGGRSGNNTMHALLLLLGKVIPLRPDYVVLMEATNDVGSLTTNGTYWSSKGPLRISEDETISLERSGQMLVNSTIPNTSQMFQAAGRRLRELARGSAAQAGETAVGEEISRSDIERKGRDYASAVRSFVRVAKAWDVTPVLMTQINVQATSDEERQSVFTRREHVAGKALDPLDFATTQAYFNAIMREVAASEDVLLIDLAEARRWAFGDVYDGLHFTDEGSEAAAQIIATRLASVLASRKPRAQAPSP